MLSNIESLDISNINSNILYEILNNINSRNLFIKKFGNQLNSKISNKLASFIIEIPDKKYNINFIDAIFVSKIIINLENKIKYTKNKNRKHILNSLIDKSNNIISDIFKGNQYNLKELINEIENFYLETKRINNKTRDLFYEEINKYYNQKNNQKNNKEKYKKQLKKILLNKKLSYSNTGQIFNPVSRNRKQKVIAFLQNNNILNHLNDVNKFYESSKKIENKDTYKKFKNKFITNTQKKKQLPEQLPEQIFEDVQQQQLNRQNTKKKNYKLLSNSEQTKEDNIKNLIDQLNYFIKNSKEISKLSHKYQLRKKLGDLLEIQVSELENFNDKNFKDDKIEDKTLNDILYKINDAFIEYNKKQWLNKDNTINKIKNIKELLLKLNPKLSFKHERDKEDNIRILIIKLNNFIKNSQNIKIASKKELRKKLEQKLKLLIESLSRFNDKSFNNKQLENKTLNDILNNIINTLDEYNKDNDIKIDDKNNKIKNIDKLLFEINPELN